MKEIWKTFMPTDRQLLPLYILLGIGALTVIGGLGVVLFQIIKAIFL